MASPGSVCCSTSVQVSYCAEHRRIVNVSKCRELSYLLHGCCKNALAGARFAGPPVLGLLRGFVDFGIQAASLNERFDQGCLLESIVLALLVQLIAGSRTVMTLAQVS